MRQRMSNLHASIVPLLGAALLSGCTNLSTLPTLAMPSPTSLPSMPAVNLPSMRPAEKAERLKDLPSGESAHVCMVAAEGFESAGRDADAVPLYEKARQLDGKLGPQVTRRLAVLYGRLGQFDRAKSEFTRALAQSPSDADLLNDLGYMHYSRGLWSEAEPVLRKAVGANPKHERAWINLGMTLGQQERYPESLEAFVKVISPAKAKCNLGLILAVQGKREKAIQMYQDALVDEPDLQLAQTALDRLRSDHAALKTAATVRPRRQNPSRTAPDVSAPIYVTVENGIVPSTDDADGP